jgi:hypothetical protein
MSVGEMRCRAACSENYQNALKESLTDAGAELT